jgi:hypothetical protein
MRHQVLVVAGVVGLAAQPALSMPVPVADVPAMAQASDLVVVGRAVQTPGQASLRGIFFITADRFLKGAAAGPARSVVVQLDRSSDGHASVAEGRYGVFFLRHESGTSAYVPTDPFHPSLFASPLRVTSQPASTDVLAGLAQELIAVLTASAATLTDPVSGVHDAMFAAPADQAQDVQYEAARALATMPYSVAGPALQAVAGSNQLPARLWAMYGLFSMPDFNDQNAKADYIQAVAPVLVDPPAEAESAVLALGSATEGKLYSPKAVPTLASLLGSKAGPVRRAAAAGLSEIATPDVVAPLAQVALGDADELVRLFAVQGLARVTGAGEAPTLAAFRGNEDRLLQFWRGWAASNVRRP